MRPFVLSIAGNDPCGGAGLLADIKTIENHKVYGLGIISAITFQNENDFIDVEYVSKENIKRQIEVLSRKYRFDFVKIGLIENLEVLDFLVSLLKTDNENIKIVWDPIIKASAGFEFHSSISEKSLKSILDKVFLVTPNIPESISLFGTNDATGIQSEVGMKTNILLKGGHSNDELVTDFLITKKSIESFKQRRSFSFDKHGTGCVLSAAIISNLALGMDLVDSCAYAQKYVSEFIQSNNSLLGYHKTDNNIEE